MATNATEAAEGRAAGARAQAKVNGITGGGINPDSIITPSMGEVQAPAGTYLLVAKTWRKLVSELGKPREYITHRRGETVELNSAHAERLLRAGAVKPLSDEQAESAAAQSVDPLTRAQQINAQAGLQQPVVDTEQGQKIADPAPTVPPGTTIPTA